MAAFVESPEPAGTRNQSWAVAAVFLSVLALAWGLIAFSIAIFKDAPAAGTGAGAGSEAAETVAPARLTLKEFTITPASVTAAAGSSIAVTNIGNVAHDVHVVGKDLTSGLIEPGASGQLALTGLAPGSYGLYCTLPGHESSGMVGKLSVVEAAAGAATAPAPPAEHGSEQMSADEMDEQMAVNTKAFLGGVKTQGGPGGQDLAPTVLGDGTKQFDLTTKVVDWEVEPGKIVKAWTYNGVVPGPTIRVNPGDKVSVVVRNELPESTSIHFHGLTTPNAQDGVPDITQTPIKPGQTYTYSFTAQSNPMVGMYHSHHNAVKQVPNGLAATFLIGRMPVPAGTQVSQEIPMMLDDSGTIGYAINGKSFPATAPLAAKLGDSLMIHYLNEGSQIHPMHLHGLDQVVIAKDGHPLPAPQTMDTVTVAPGERYTVLVKATVPGAWAWHCHILSHAETEKGMFGMVTALVVS
jgi:uncharacterized cupredoxin-like copper-binding protein